MADNIVEFPKAKDDTKTPLPRVLCGACGSAEWHLILPHPELRRGELACAFCSVPLGLWMETAHEPPSE